MTNAILEALPIAILRLNAKGQVIFINDAARAILGIESIGSFNFSDLFEGLGRSVGDWVRDAFGGNNLRKPEILRLCSDVDDKHVQIILDEFYCEDVKELIATIIDATDIKTLQNQLMQSQKMEAIGQLSGGIAHDFNNILTAILGYIDLVLDNFSESHPERQNLIYIKQNAERAAGLVRQLLAFSRKQNLCLVKADLRVILSNLTQLLTRLVGEKIHIIQHHDPWLHAVRVDLHQVEQVVMNLVLNSRDSMPSGGKIEIRTENLHLKKPLKHGRAVLSKGNYVKITVSDTGCGIHPKILPKIFEPFFSTKKIGKGTGLGLSTVYGIIKQSDGFIFAESPKTGGTVFTILLPACFDDRLDFEKLDKNAPLFYKKPDFILLVEDEESVRTLLSKTLRSKGYNVIEVASGTNALKLMDDETFQVDLIVSDAVMPGLNGPAWIKAAREKRGRIKAIIMSGYAEESLDKKIKDLGDTVFLQKPFSTDILIKTIEKITNMKKQNG